VGNTKTKETNDNMYDKIFVSQNEQTYHPELACGIASLTMVLKYYNIPVSKSFEELADELRFTMLPVDKGYDGDDQQYGTFPEDIFRFCIVNNFNFRMSFYDDEWKDALKKAPIMVLLTGNIEEFGLRNCHWVVLVERDKDYFTYLDPWETKASGNYIKHIWALDFKRYYTGIACQIFGI
jgi:uncharacterized protein YvpB